VKPGSDLFRKIEAENAALRARLVEIEKQRDEDRKAREKAELAAIAAAEDEKAAESKLEEAASHGAQDKARMEDVLSRIPELENKLAMAQAHQASQAPVAEKREAELASFREELARREYRLRKAEKMAAMLQEARRDVQKVSDREKRDMHYNMAAVYERDGRYREAEREYLQALEIDPSDAACHFNLGILYDDRLGDKRRAAIHYRRYLKLDPHSTDVDQVKSWLMKIDMD
jgi:Tfp pilus assembly protein PilF